MSLNTFFLLFALVAVAASQPVSEEAQLDLATCTSGKRKGNTCCASACTVCGGPDCGAPNMGDKCCISQIRAAGRSCATFPAPCVIPILPTPSNSPSASITPTPEPPSSDSNCSTGILNRLGTVCCDIGCGRCGGSGCRQLPGGARNCCKGRIEKLTNGTTCDDMFPPCIMAVAMPPSPSVTPSVTPSISMSVTPSISPSPSDATDPNCNQGIKNNANTVCCLASCITCGGSNCGNRDGGGNGCCTGKILSANKKCANNLPPCVL